VFGRKNLEEIFAPSQHTKLNKSEMFIQNKKLFLGERIRQAWKEIRNEKENIIYADVEYIKAAGIEEVFSVLSEYTELDIRLTARQDNSSVKNLVTLNSPDGGGIYWHGCGKRMLFRNPEQKIGDKYCDAILALEQHRGSVVLSPISLLNTVFPDESVRLCSNIQAFYGIIRPLVLERDSNSNLPRKRNHTERPDGCRTSGWLSYVILQAAKKSLFPFGIIWSSLVNDKSKDTARDFMSILEGLLHRFQQILTCRNEIDWAYFESGDVLCRFDHLSLLGTAMLDQLAALICRMANEPGNGFGISLNPNRGGKNRKDNILSAIDKMTLEYKDELESTSSTRRFLYSFRNISAHQNPSRGVTLPPDLLDHAKMIIDKKTELADQAIIGNNFDPLIMSWFITDQVAKITRIVLMDYATRFGVSIDSSFINNQDNFFKPETVLVPIMGAWNMPLR
jgi:hypothetical protein